MEIYGSLLKCWMLAFQIEQVVVVYSLDQEWQDDDDKAGKSYKVNNMAFMAS